VFIPLVPITMIQDPSKVFVVVSSDIPQQSLNVQCLAKDEGAPFNVVSSSNFVCKGFVYEVDKISAQPHAGSEDQQDQIVDPSVRIVADIGDQTQLITKNQNLDRFFRNNLQDQNLDC